MPRHSRKKQARPDVSTLRQVISLAAASGDAHVAAALQRLVDLAYENVQRTFESVRERSGADPAVTEASPAQTDALVDAALLIAHTMEKAERSGSALLVYLLEMALAEAHRELRRRGRIEPNVDDKRLRR